MATFDKDVFEEMVTKYGSWENFARADGCYRIYESDSNYHTVRKSSDEESILNSPYIKNPRQVWPNRRAVTVSTSSEATEAKHVNSIVKKERFYMLADKVAMFIGGIFLILIIIDFLFAWLLGSGVGFSGVVYYR